MDKNESCCEHTREIQVEEQQMDFKNSNYLYQLESVNCIKYLKHYQSDHFVTKALGKWIILMLSTERLSIHLSEKVFEACEVLLS